MRWAMSDHADGYTGVAHSIQTIIEGWIDPKVNRMSGGGWMSVDYHVAALALLAASSRKISLRVLCRDQSPHDGVLPNNLNGHRLSDPSVSTWNVLTPYFGHFALTALLQPLGEARFVLNSVPKLLGLGSGRQTYHPRSKYSDTCWSHCHEWSGCPTWQLSRYILGLRPRFDLGDKVFELEDPNRNLKQSLRGNVPISAVVRSRSLDQTVRKIKVSSNLPSQFSEDERKRHCHIRPFLRPFSTGNQETNKV